MPPKIARGLGTAPVRVALGVVGGLYIAMVFLGSAGSSLPREVLPRAALFFTQVACLFPKAATHSIEYRAAALPCDRSPDFELETRHDFPMRPDDKENRFHRLGFFHRRDPRVLEALDRHLVASHNARALEAKPGAEKLIGGVAIMSLRIPLPSPGDAVPRHEHVGYQDVPPEWRKYWYRTPKDELRARCRELWR